LNEVKESLSYMAKRPRADAHGGIAGFKDIPRCQGCRDV
jgi:hypothetical protein